MTNKNFYTMIMNYNIIKITKTMTERVEISEPQSEPGRVKARYQ
ncbi:hypothetical protein [Anaerocolumna xylanovorans]|nr:hypothetical protein [Anaerocolumna xylanovorans]